MELAARIGQAISEAHTAVEATALAQAMVSATVGREQYLELLCQLLLIHESLESRIESNAVCAGVFRPGMARAATVRGDLTHLGGTPRPPLADTARLLGMMDTVGVGLIGVLYVLEGSRMGSLVLGRTVAEALGVAAMQGNGLDYHLAGADSRVQDWRAFRETINRLGLTSVELDAVTEAAVLTMNAFVGLYTAIGGGRQVATTPNEAGGAAQEGPVPPQFSVSVPHTGVPTE